MAGKEKNQLEYPGDKIKVKICIGTNCSFKGSQLLLDRLENEPLLAGRLEIEVTRCIDHQCEDGKHSPVLQVDGEVWRDASIEVVSSALIEKARRLRGEE